MSKPCLDFKNFLNYICKKIKIMTEAQLPLQEIIDNNSVTLAFFSASWCGPCKVMTPIIQEITQEFKNKIGFSKINVDENPSLALDYGIMGVPTLIFFKNGKVVERVSGAKSKVDVVNKLNEIL